MNCTESMTAVIEMLRDGISLATDIEFEPEDTASFELYVKLENISIEVDGLLEEACQGDLSSTLEAIDRAETAMKSFFKLLRKSIKNKPQP